MEVLDVEALTLDFFGTLVDGGEAALAEVATAVVEDLDLPLTPDAFVEAWSERYFAMNEGPFVTIATANEVSLRETLASMGAPADTGPYVDLMNEAWQRVRPFPEVPEFLERVAGYDLCLLSNVDDGFLTAQMARHGLAFERIVTSEGVKAYKPDPRIFHAALDLLQRPPERVLHVGDTPEMDVLGARNMRMRVAWVNRRGRTLEDHIPAPDVVVTDLLELADHLEG